jgi:hypothetical protein
VAPFSDTAYALLGVPVAVALLLYGALGGFSSREDISSYYRARGARYGLLPWVAIFAIALGLEIAGLALGGRSTDVPTLSTTIDHLLVTHWGRWILYLWWLWVGARPIEALTERQRRREPS